MRVAAFFVAFAPVLLAGQAFAQTTLPPVVVEAPKVKKAPKAKKAAAKKPAKSPDTQAKQDLPPVKGETALGPVDGLVATRSATGSKTDVPLLEIPRSVEVITSEQLAEQQAKSIRDAIGYAAGVQSQTGAGSIRDVIGVRGFMAPIFLDGLLLPTDTGLGFARIRLEPYGLERLEILKGPASALFGQVPPGGLINAVSKRPQDEASKEVYFQLGTNNQKEVGFDLTGPAGDLGKLSYRLVGLARDTDLDFDYADRQRFFLASSLTYRPSSDTSLTLLASIQRDSGFGPHQFVPLKLTKESAPFGRIDRSTYLGEPGFDTYQEDQWYVGYVLQHKFNGVFEFRQSFRYAESDQFIVAMRAGAPDADLRTINRLINGVKAGFQGVAVDNQLEANFVTGLLSHKLLFGLDYQLTLSNADFRSLLGAKIDAYDPQYGIGLKDPFTASPLVLNTSALQQTGVYLQDQIKLGGWMATLGLRHDWATTELDDLRPNATDKHQEIDDAKWTGFAGLSYVFANGLAPYVSYSTSFLPATGSSLINATTKEPLLPTTGEGYEAGIKYQPPGMKMLLTAALFQITQQNIATTDPVTFVVTQTGEVRVRGLELGIKARVGPNLEVIGGYAYMEPIITSTVPVGNIGNDFQNVSRHTGSLWGMYHWHEGPLAGLGLGLGVRYVGTQFADPANAAQLDPFTLVDAALTYDLERIFPQMHGVKLQLNALNLFDTYYVAACTGGENFCQLGQSRAFLATLKYKW